ncbi:hypothetical protein LUZ63_010411 [Rhynchospora breviuscula]|uniref:Auxilin-like protein n=1 Tax=Rhynchospora breviuscula TaxID=2022672 RepID=A0A9Q0CGY8_9POAL|nr:hypothetical protein LUZ63_010411 [Rhynchospora breviuscula]
MDDMSGILARDFGIRPQGKAAPMAASKTASTYRSTPSSSTWTNNASPSYDDFFSSAASSAPANSRYAASPPLYDDFLGGLGTTERKDDKDQGSVKTKASGLSGFDDLLPGFRSSVPLPQPKRETPETDLPKPPKPASNVQDDPFSVFETVTSTPSVPSSGLFFDPLDEFSRPAASGPTKVDSSPIADNLFSENSNSFESGQIHNGREKSPDLNGSFREKVNPKISARDTSPIGSFNKNGTDESSPLDNYEIPMGQAGRRSMGSDSFSRNQKLVEDPSPESSENSETGEDIWLTVSEIPLFTRPTSAPPPSRPPPPLTVKAKRRQNYSFRDSSPVDDLENFAMGKPPSQKFEYDEEEMERSSAAMKDAMDKAQAKFRHAKEVREKMRSKEAEQLERDDSEREMAEKEREEREREERERERERRRMEREEEERRRKEKEEREKARLAVERATREARERAANDARLRAERAAVLRAQQEARERAAADARERAAAEAKEKAEREVREKATAAAAMERERAEREAREKAAAERLEREKAEKDRQARSQRAAVERAAAEARERLAQAARERHQQQSQAQQRKPDPVQQRRPEPPQQQKTPEDDLESFFGSRANSAPRPARPATESLFETQTQTKGPDASRRAASVSGASIPKASSVNMMDDLSAIFGAPSSSGGDFQEIEGESEERRHARLERHRRTEERARKALQEKNERDMQAQREQAERHRIAESMDFEIKRWAAGKEGNLRALLGSLHYILWQECGWQPVSMADLITGAAVKKVYRKATLCIHPDKVQQKGATLQQKYIAEKVFDILKEAWNKFNSEELF